MNGSLLRWMIPVAALAVVVLPCCGKEQTQQTENRQAGTQQTGVVQPVGAISSRSSSTAKSTATRSPGAISGASSWSAGQRSFGTTGAMPAATRGAAGAGGAAGNAGQSSWVAGGGSFGSTVQHGGIWRDSAGPSETSSSASTKKPANGTVFSFAMPGSTSTHSAFTTKPVSAAGDHATFPRTLNRPHVGGGLRPGGSNRFLEGSHLRETGRTRTGLGQRDFRNRSGSGDRGKSGMGWGQKSSGYDSTAQTPFGFTPFDAKPGRDTTSKGSASTPPQ